MQQDLTQGSIRAGLIRFSLPLIAGNLLQQLYNVADTLIVGRFLGNVALAAVGSAFSLMILLTSLVLGLCMGSGVVFSQLYGEGNMDKLKTAMTNAFCLIAALSVLLTVLSYALLDAFIVLLRVPPEAVPDITSYLRVIFAGIFFTFLYNFFAAALRSVGDSRTPVVYLALASVMNAGLDVLLVAVFRWGVVGAGVATVMAEGISALLCAWHIYRRIPLLHLARRELKIDRRLLRETVSSGAITAMQQACQPIGKALIQSVMNAQGVSVIAAFNAVSRVDDFACIPEQSISSSMMTCIAQNRGAGEHARVGETLRRGMMIEAAYGVLICAAVLLAKELVMRLFAAQDSMQMVSMGVDYLTLMAFFYILPGITNGIQGYFRGMGEMKTTLVATFIQISIRALVVAVLVPRIGLNGAAWACAVGWSAMLCYTFARYRRVRENE